MVVKCVSRCLRCIEPSLQLPESMPSGMAQKYGVTLALAEKCTEIGFRGEIGYQTFLYSNNLAELRRVLMFLIDKLPKDESDNVTQGPRESTEMEKIDAEIRKSLGVSLKRSKKQLAEDNSRILFSAAKDFDSRRSVYAQTTPGNLLSTLIVNNDSGPLRRGDTFRALKEAKGLQSSSSTNSMATEETIPEAPPKEDPVEEKRLQIETLREQIHQKHEQKMELSQKIKELKRRSVAGKEKLDELKQQKKIKERTLLVLENPQENIQKLNKMIDNSSEKMKRLQEQWMEHKTPLQMQIEEINEKKKMDASKTKVRSLFIAQDPIDSPSSFPSR